MLMLNLNGYTSRLRLFDAQAIADIASAYYAYMFFKYPTQNSHSNNSLESPKRNHSVVAIQFACCFLYYVKHPLSKCYTQSARQIKLMLRTTIIAGKIRNTMHPKQSFKLYSHMIVDNNITHMFDATVAHNIRSFT